MRRIIVRTLTIVVIVVSPSRPEAPDERLAAAAERRWSALPPARPTRIRVDEFDFESMSRAHGSRTTDTIIGAKRDFDVVEQPSVNSRPSRNCVATERIASFIAWLLLVVETIRLQKLTRSSSATR